MELTTFNIIAYILIPILTAVIGGWVGAYLGSKYQENKEENKMAEIRDIAVKALTILKKYAKQEYSNAEDDFNTSLTITDKRCVIVLLHKLGVPVYIPANERFDIHRIHFANRIVDSEDLDGIILQIQQKHCDNLFFLDAETYFSSNLQFTAIREVGKRYVKEVLSKSIYNKETKQVTYPDGWVTFFGLGEYYAVRILHEQACTDLLYDQTGKARPEKIEQILREIDMGIWDNCLLGNYEMYRNAKAQIEMSTVFQTIAKAQQRVKNE
jgi:hypothetical protein